MQSRIQRYSRYGGDYGQYMQRQDLASVSTEAAKHGHLPLAMDYLGRFADTPRTSSSYGLPSTVVAVWHLARHVANLPPAERYPMLLDWTMPTDTRQTVRVAVGYNPGDVIPHDVVRHSLGDRTHASTEIPTWMTRDFGAISNLRLLIDAALESGKLDQLTQQAAAAATNGIDGANTLHALCCVAAGDRAAGEPLVRAVMKDSKLRQDGTKGTSADRRPKLRDFIVMQAMLRSPEFVDLGMLFYQQLLQFARDYRGGDAMLTHLGYEMAMAGLRKAPPEERELAARPGLKLWFQSSPPLTTHADMPSAVWATHEGQVAHRTGYEHSSLYFRYPLTGNFEFTYDAFDDRYAAGECAYGGLMCEPAAFDKVAGMRPISYHEHLILPACVHPFPGFNRRMTIQVSEKSTRFRVNKHLFYEDDRPNTTSPWLHLVCYRHRQIAYRNAKITGSPIIPREIALTSEDRLDGWDASLLGQNLPLRLTGNTGDPNASSARSVQPRLVDWWSEDGVIHGRLSGSTAADQAQGHLRYQRPLRSGDSLRYEFFHKRGKTHVHPSVGRLAFLTQPDGVQLHWISIPNDTTAMFDIPARNWLVEPDCQRGPAQLPLANDAWNRAEVSLEGETVRIQLNGQLVYERALEPTNDRRFGVFHFRDQTAAQVRNVTMTGDWPSSLTAEQMANPFMEDDSAKTPGVRLTATQSWAKSISHATSTSIGWRPKA